MEKAEPITEGGERVHSTFRCGTVAIAGRPNVGKSTLLNRVLGAKLAIVTPKPQTTRSRVLGIRTTPEWQTVWIDAPGLRGRLPEKTLMNERMEQTARQTIADADVVVLVVDAANGTGESDREAGRRVTASGRPWVIAANKIDLLPRERMIPLLAELGTRHPDVDVVPISAATGENVDELESIVARRLPAGPALYPEDDLTDQSGRTIVQEFVREKVFELTAEEIPYRTAVLVESFVEKPERNLNVVHATIFVERDSQKKILIGEGGSRIREIGQRARLDLEAFFGVRFHLQLFVKVRRDWARDPRVLDEIGI
ncbi:MAG: GTPase [Candidatus Binatota bacterium]|nr:GTPase [Candidatus Binatota bacterium]